MPCAPARLIARIEVALLPDQVGEERHRQIVRRAPPRRWRAQPARDNARGGPSRGSTGLSGGCSKLSPSSYSNACRPIGGALDHGVGSGVTAMADRIGERSRRRRRACRTKPAAAERRGAQRASSNSSLPESHVRRAGARATAARSLFVLTQRIVLTAQVVPIRDPTVEPAPLRTSRHATRERVPRKFGLGNCAARDDSQGFADAKRNSFRAIAQ